MSKQADVVYSAKQMFALVNDIESYPEFLPWCIKTDILENKGNSLIASVLVSLGKIKQSFTTKNTMQKYVSINITLVEGPFKELNGHWQFNDNINGNCCILLDMQFEFKNKIMKYAFGAAFKKITDSMIDAFIERARVVYGSE